MADDARMGRTVILASDLDAAAEAYRAAFGWRTLVDAEPAPGRRYLHVGPPSQPNVGVWFLRPAGDAGRARIGAQTGGEPLLVLYVDDLGAAVVRAEGAGMRPEGEEGEDGTSRWRHLTDPLGNGIVMVQLSEGAG